jgi:alpha-beta hydrolase superfamily lysophospholipase
MTIKTQSTVVKASDGVNIAVYHWPCTKEAIGVIHIVHGMSEHALRYDWLAQQLNSAGYHVYAHDHRGHGNTKPTVLGHYADDNGWHHVVDDVLQVNTTIKQKHSLPITLLAHSMGSFIAQAFAIKHHDKIDNLVLSASNYQNPALYKAAKVVAKLEQMRQGAKGQSKLLNFLTFGSFNKDFKPNRTDFDWLSRESEQVDTYINDPLCGFICTNQTWIQLFSGLIYISDVNNLANISADLPIYILGGDLDPVGLKGKGLKALHKALEDSGHNNVTLKLYAEGRHEMFNESNKQEVVNDLQDWLLKTLEK